MKPQTVCIVSCTSHKRDYKTFAENLYSSELFYRSRRYAQSRYDSWLILSAKHGLIRPDVSIAPYDCKLDTLSKKERESLAKLVNAQALTLLPASAKITSICGEEYDSLLNLPVSHSSDYPN